MSDEPNRCAYDGVRGEARCCLTMGHFGPHRFNVAGRSLGSMQSEVQKDAARYQWLRSRWPTLITTSAYDGKRTVVTGLRTAPRNDVAEFDTASLDAAIDRMIE